MDETEDQTVQIKISDGTEGSSYLATVTATCTNTQVLKAQIRVYVD